MAFSEKGREATKFTTNGRMKGQGKMNKGLLVLAAAALAAPLGMTTPAIANSTSHCYVGPNGGCIDRNQVPNTFNYLVPIGCQVSKDQNGNVYTYLIAQNEYLEAIDDDVLGPALLSFCHSTNVGFFVTDQVTGSWNQLSSSSKAQTQPTQ